MLDDMRRTQAMLSVAEFQVLQNSIPPTARRWLRIHGLSGHGANTLLHWGEALVDDHGRSHEAPK